MLRISEKNAIKYTSETVPGLILWWTQLTTSTKVSFSTKDKTRSRLTQETRKRGNTTILPSQRATASSLWNLPNTNSDIPTPIARSLPNWPRKKTILTDIWKKQKEIQPKEWSPKSQPRGIESEIIKRSRWLRKVQEGRLLMILLLERSKKCWKKL